MRQLIDIITSSQNFNGLLGSELQKNGYIDFVFNQIAMSSSQMSEDIMIAGDTTKKETLHL